MGIPSTLNCTAPAGIEFEPLAANASLDWRPRATKD
jgi:hypothetical protein